jgi:hypothetical protein
MSFLTLKSKPLLLAAAALSLTMAASCELPAADGVINFELTGQVLDFDTKQPIEGAYVLAVYEKVYMGFAASARYCVKTKGMLSDKEGRFHFPVEKLDSNSPAKLAAIKSDYYFHREKPISEKSAKAQNKETYSNRDVYLKRQDPAKLEFHFGYTTCNRPESREAVDANIEFLKLRKAEAERITHSFSWSKSYIENIDSMIHGLQTRDYPR